MTRAAAATRLFDTGCHSSPGGDSARQRAADAGCADYDPLASLERAVALLAGADDEGVRLLAEWLGGGGQGDPFAWLTGAETDRGPYGRLAPALVGRPAPVRE